jgi:hypothetical protein
VAPPCCGRTKHKVLQWTGEQRLESVPSLPYEVRIDFIEKSLAFASASAPNQAERTDRLIGRWRNVHHTGVFRWTANSPLLDCRPRQSHRQEAARRGSAHWPDNNAHCLSTYSEE